VSTERLLISSNWRWFLLHRIVYCSHISLHFLPTYGDWDPLIVGAPGCSPVSTSLNPPLQGTLCFSGQCQVAQKSWIKKVYSMQWKISRQT